MNEILTFMQSHELREWNLTDSRTPPGVWHSALDIHRKGQRLSRGHLRWCLQFNEPIPIELNEVFLDIVKGDYFDGRGGSESEAVRWARNMESDKGFLTYWRDRFASIIKAGQVPETWPEELRKALESNARAHRLKRIRYKSPSSRALEIIAKAVGCSASTLQKMM